MTTAAAVHHNAIGPPNQIGMAGVGGMGGVVEITMAIVKLMAILVRWLVMLLLAVVVAAATGIPVVTLKGGRQ